MIFVDTGFFLALFNPKDELHVRAERWAEAVLEPLLVTEYVLWECVNTLSLPEDRPTAHHLLEHVRAASGFEVIEASPGVVGSRTEAAPFAAGQGMVADGLHFVRGDAKSRSSSRAGVRPTFRASGF